MSFPLRLRGPKTRLGLFERSTLLLVTFSASLQAAIVFTLLGLSPVALLSALIGALGVAALAATCLASARHVAILHSGMVRFAAGEFPVIPPLRSTISGALQAPFSALVSAGARSGEARMRESLTDSLTGLPNRRHFMTALSESCQVNDLPIAVVFVDLDGFKAVNDALGHQTGDKLLGAISRRFASSITGEHLFARVGGDEFMVLIRGEEARERAIRLAQAVTLHLKQPLTVADRELFISASIGIADGVGGRHTGAELVRRADVAGYRAKAAGKARWVEYDLRMDGSANERLKLSSDLHRAVGRNELSLAFQPEVDLLTGSVLGFEALVRWKHPALGLIEPDRFIPLAEESGEINELGRWVLEEACRTTVALVSDLRVPGMPLTVAVNVSSAQLSSTFVDDVQAVLVRTGLAPQRLKLEITESMLLGDFERVRLLLDELKRVGVLIALDDFGTGFSSLSYLSRLPIDFVKIDQSFVRRMLTDVRTRAVVRGICELSRAIGAEITAEGIEDPGQVQLLADAGCGRGQGFYFAPPLPKQALDSLLRHPSFKVPGAA